MLLASKALCGACNPLSEQQEKLAGTRLKLALLRTDGPSRSSTGPSAGRSTLHGSVVLSGIRSETHDELYVLSSRAQLSWP